MHENILCFHSDFSIHIYRYRECVYIIILFKTVFPSDQGPQGGEYKNIKTFAQFKIYFKVYNTYIKTYEQRVSKPGRRACNLYWGYAKQNFKSFYWLAKDTELYLLALREGDSKSPSGSSSKVLVPHLFSGPASDGKATEAGPPGS